MGLIEDAIELANRPDWYGHKYLSGRTPGRHGARLPFADSDTAREEECWFFLQMYKGLQEQFIDKYPDETVEEFAKRWKCTINLTRPIIDILSGLYRRAPQRTIEAADRIKKRMHRVWRESETDSFMISADRTTRLTGTVAVRPYYDKSTGRVRYWLFTQDKLRVIEDEENPASPKAVVVRWVTRDSRNPRKLVRIAHIWTAEEFTKLVNGAEVKGARTGHGFGCVPLVFFHDKQDFESFFTYGRGRDICQTNCVINNKLTHKLETIIYQGLGIPVLKNPSPNKEIVFSPKRAITIELPPGREGGLEFVSPNAPIAELLQDIEADVQHLLLANRIPESAIRIKAGPASGVAIIAENIPLIEDREERMRLFASKERELAELTLKTLNEFEDDFDFSRDSDDFDFHVNYKEPEFPLNVTERITRDEFLLRNGLIRPWQIWMRDDPDRFPGEDEARKTWEKEKVTIADSHQSAQQKN